MSHMQLVMMIIVFGSVVFVSFLEFSANRANIHLAHPNPCEAIVRKTVKNL